MGFIHGTDKEVIIAKNLAGYRRNLVEDARIARAELMRKLWARRPAGELEPLRIGLEVMERKISEVDKLTAKVGG